MRLFLIILLVVTVLSACQVTVGGRFIDSWEDSQEGGKYDRKSDSQYVPERRGVYNGS